MRQQAVTARTPAIHRLARFAVPLIVATLLAFAPRAGAAELHGKVVGVADGDTLTVLDAAHVTHRIRLNGIDAPEKGQSYGARAKDQLSAFVFSKLVVVIWAKHDRYGRIVGEVRLAAPASCAAWGCPQSGDVGLAMIEAGLAWHYKRYQGEQSLDNRQRYARAEDEARSKRIGLWHDPHPVAPWDYRSSHRADAARTQPASRIN